MSVAPSLSSRMSICQAFFKQFLHLSLLGVVWKQERSGPEQVNTPRARSSEESLNRVLTCALCMILAGDSRTGERSSESLNYRMAPFVGLTRAPTGEVVTYAPSAGGRWNSTHRVPIILEFGDKSKPRRGKGIDWTLAMLMQLKLSRYVPSPATSSSTRGSNPSPLGGGDSTKYSIALPPRSWGRREAGCKPRLPGCWRVPSPVGPGQEAYLRWLLKRFQEYGQVHPPCWSSKLLFKLWRRSWLAGELLLEMSWTQSDEVSLGCPALLNAPYLSWKGERLPGGILQAYTQRDEVSQCVCYIYSS